MKHFAIRSFNFLILALLLATYVPTVAQAAVNDGSDFILGAWQTQVDLGAGVSLADYEASLGIRFTHHKSYVDWDVSFAQSGAASHRAAGKVPEITWQPWIQGKGIAFGDIAAGQYDTYITQFARDVKAFNTPIFIAIAPEMDGWWSPWAINGQPGRTNTDFINGYRRIVDIFNEQGATKVSWIWSPNVQSPGGPQVYNFSQLYPGDAYATYMGLDGYNWGTNAGGTWMSFETVFRYSYNSLIAISDKKILLMETGSAEEGGDKAAWIREMFTSLKDFPKIAGFTWFNRNRERDWRIHSSLASKQAFKEGAASFFNPQSTGTSGTKVTPSPTSSSSQLPSNPSPGNNAGPEPSQVPTRQKVSSTPTFITTPTAESTLAPIPEIIQNIVEEVKGFWRDSATNQSWILICGTLAVLTLGYFVVPGNRRRLGRLMKSLFH